MAQNVIRIYLLLVKRINRSGEIAKAFLIPGIKDFLWHWPCLKVLVKPNEPQTNVMCKDR